MRLGPYQRRQADDERDGGHHHRAKAEFCAEFRRFPDAQAALPLSSWYSKPPLVPKPITGGKLNGKTIAALIC